ncbi:GNAT family N-acetyltransferase [Alloacidobacterium dinghuense]|uniref:GNAT family N-acetyltransferase n=1 Tax=Alloacidobacterium dinghuense TaxID=2763107 RepID=A0A7G8BNC5_9BACT|nr:GNAT family N-acetyltransferase [Alloacidobacterium dinghuense]QNI34045.1 GNAT family N-acetyltransferase [Alloacidobacterium dinghuense]
MAILYRKAEESDFPGMVRLRALKRGNKDYWSYRITRYFDGEYNPQQALRPRVGFVAVEGEVVIGFITGHLTSRYSCDGEVQWIHVDPDRRRSGIASELLRMLAQWFVEQMALKVCVDVDPSNTAGLAFYTRHGAVQLIPHWMYWSDVHTVTHEQSGAAKTAW